MKLCIVYVEDDKCGYRCMCVVVCDTVRYGVLGVFLFKAEDGIRDLVRSRGLGDVYKRQILACFADAAEQESTQANCPDDDQNP